METITNAVFQQYDSVFKENIQYSLLKFDKNLEWQHSLVGKSGHG